MDEYEVCGIKCTKPNANIEYWTGKDGDIKISMNKCIYYDLNLNPNIYFDVYIIHVPTANIGGLSTRTIANGRGKTFEEAKQNLEMCLKEKYAVMRRLMPRIM